MPDIGLAEWLQARSFYTLLILCLVALAVLVARMPSDRFKRRDKHAARKNPGGRRSGKGRDSR